MARYDRETKVYFDFRELILVLMLTALIRIVAQIQHND